MPKQFKLSKEQIRPLITGYGGCIASDKITVEGLPVGFMYREEPINDMDSGWRFMSGYEDETYMDDSRNHSIYEVNTIANYDPTIISFLDSPVGSVYEKRTESKGFVAVTDWNPPEE
ncbi:MAG TPA: DUF2185 domain-containing protein [Noviherbaspirillum sp.]|jgi:hypothetical protein|uniref:DUF2185 domain-containing protein n=1 Tax=Noviherbaspirillum sp. TaxID=1926288 RepID=UPI002DDDA21B|nr:DUF2185 domain-containing protein [Noviherbaspirillum sp.]HEV2612098.1 DUF2185 domain-containing protein [Noviherbaspirillum sp.]